MTENDAAPARWIEVRADGTVILTDGPTPRSVPLDTIVRQVTEALAPAFAAELERTLAAELKRLASYAH